MIAFIAGVVLVLLVIRARTVLTVSTHAVVGMVYCAGSLSAVLPTRFLLIPVVLTAVAACKRTDRNPRGWLLWANMLVLTAAFALFAALSWMTWWSQAAGEVFVRYLLLFISAAWLGRELLRGDKLAGFGSVYMKWSFVMAGLAMVEYLRDATLIERTDLEYNIVRDGRIRSIVFAEHPLVLATLLTLALPVVMRASSRTRQVIGAAVVLAGIYATQSRGPLVLALLYVSVRLFLPAKPRVVVSARSLVFPTAVLAMVASGVALIAGPTVTSGELSSYDPAQASLQYRVALYVRVADSLIARPFGWGPMGLPEGVYLIDSPLGTVDLAVSIDSEPVLLVLEYGVVGLILFLAVFTVAVDRLLRVGNWSSDASMLLVACSTFLAIHSWTGLGTAAFLLIGAAGAAPVQRGAPAADRPTLIGVARR
ncbi:O-antigen ligase family protein [Geodermatophilus sp. SYSU D00710]